jgi:upstream activation factor subunit UAF30
MLEENNNLENSKKQITNVVINNDDNIGLQFNDIVNSLSQFKQSITLLQGQIRTLEKTIKKEVKTLQKEVIKSKNKGNRKPSGFAKPSKVTDELCNFMGKELGSEVARTEVTQYLIKYIKEKNLQYKDNKKIIIPDNELKTLLNVDNDQEVTYFNLQKLMNRHFINNTKNMNKLEETENSGNN